MEETIGYQALFSPEEWASINFVEWEPEPDAKPTLLPECDAVRLAAALDDYELLTVTNIGGTEESGHWLMVHDERFGLDYEIASHADYWDFLGYFCAGLQWPVKPFAAAGMA